MIPRAYVVDQMFATEKVPPERQEIRFRIAPFPRTYGNFEATASGNKAVVIYVETMDDIGTDIEPEIIRDRHVEMEYLEGSERRACHLSKVIAAAGPRSAFFITPKGDWNAFEAGRWVCKINHKDLKK